MHMHNGSDAYIAYISVGFYIVSFLTKPGNARSLQL